jgi:hypothetical protein
LLQLVSIAIDKHAANDVLPEVNIARPSEQHFRRDPQRSY